jgi:thioredoxin-like negative regulator of GroEL
MCYPRIRWKLLLACGVLTLASSSLCAQETAGIKWRSDYVAARKESEAKNLPMLIDVWRTSCLPCERMEQTTFRDPRIVAALNEKFIPLRINGLENPTLREQLGISLYPTVVLATADGRVAHTLAGFKDADFLFEHMQRVVASSTPSDAMQGDFENARKWEANGDFASAIKTLRNILDNGKGVALKRSAQELLRQIEMRAVERINAAKALQEKGQTTEALEALTDVVRLYPGIPASRQASDQIVKLAQANEGAKVEQRNKRARVLYTQAQDFYKSKDYIPCIDRCEIIIASYGDLPEGQQAFALASQIKNNREWLQNAADVMADRLGGAWLAIADSHLKSGNIQMAQSFLQKVVAAFPGSSMAESAQIRLTQLRGTAPGPKGVERAAP